MKEKMKDITHYKVYNASKPVPNGATRLWYQDGISCGTGWYDIPNQHLEEAKAYWWEDSEDQRNHSYFDMQCIFN